MAVSRVTKIERRKGQRETGPGSTSDMERKSKKERRDGSNAFRSVAGGEDGPPSKSSLVTMNGPNESRGPIKDYSRRRSAPTASGRRLSVGTEGTRNERYSLPEDGSKPSSFTPA